MSHLPEKITGCYRPVHPSTLALESGNNSCDQLWSVVGHTRWTTAQFCDCVRMVTQRKFSWTDAAEPSRGTRLPLAVAARGRRNTMITATGSSENCSLLPAPRPERRSRRNSDESASATFAAQQPQRYCRFIYKHSRKWFLFN